MAITRPNRDAATAAPAAAAPAKAAAAPAKAPAKPKPAPVAEPEPEVEDLSSDPALDNVDLHDTTMDIPDDDAPSAAPIAPVSGKSVVSRHTEDEEDDGFSDLDDEIGFGSFEILKLDKTDFVCGEHTLPARDGVTVVLHGAKKKYLYKARASKSDDDDVPLTYSYDGVRSTDGRALEEHYKEWRDAGEMEPGAKPVVTRYMEVGAEVVMPGHALDGEMVLCNVAPASVARLSGYRKKLLIKGYKLRDVITMLTIGKKVTSTKGKGKTFYPWDFKMLGRVQRGEAE